MDVFSEIVVQFSTMIESWQTVALIYAKRLFVILATIRLLWVALLWQMQKEEMTDIFNHLVKTIITIGLFWAVLTNYDVWVPTIIDSFKELGLKMTNNASINPSDVIKIGIDLTNELLSKSRTEGFFENLGSILVGILVAAVIFFCFIRIAIEMVLILIGGQIVLGGGIVMLGFAGSPWTQNYAERYFSAAVTFGLRLLFIILIVGIGQSLAVNWIDLLKYIEDGKLIDTYLSILAAAMIYYYLATRIPEMASSMLMGSFNIGMNNPTSSVQATASNARGAYGAYKSGKQFVAGKFKGKGE